MLTPRTFAIVTLAALMMTSLPTCVQGCWYNYECPGTEYCGWTWSCHSRMCMRENCDSPQYPLGCGDNSQCDAGADEIYTYTGIRYFTQDYRCWTRYYRDHISFYTNKVLPSQLHSQDYCS